MYRTMLPQPEVTPHTPAVGTDDNMLGARVPPHQRADVRLDPDGSVGPGSGGISVAPRITALPQGLVPERLRALRPGARGSNTLRVFRLGEARFGDTPVGDSLRLLPTTPKHGVLEARQSMPLNTYQQELAATQKLWVEEG